MNKYYGRRCGNCLNCVAGRCLITHKKKHPASTCTRWIGNDEGSKDGNS